jgi:hypothetical protein
VNAYGDTLVPAKDVWPICDPYAREDDGDYPLPPPDPAQRLDIPLRPADRRRLDLYAALTVRGVAPLAGDQDAVAAISSLGDAVTAAVLRWVA